MIGDIEHLWLFFLILITICITIFFVMISQDFFDKCVISFFNFSFFIYSGYGITGINVEKTFILFFVIFLLVTDSAFTFFSKRFSRTSKTSNVSILKETTEISNYLLGVLTFLFFVTLILPLIVPQFRMIELFQPPISNSKLIFEKRRMSNENTILYLAKTIQILLLPFFLILIQRLANKGKNFKWILAFILFVYLKFHEFSYLSRNEIVGYAALFFATLFLSKNLKKFRGAFLFITLIIALVSIPFFVNYQITRIGGNVTKYGYIDYINVLLSSEGYYPFYYEKIINYGISVSPAMYFLWMIFLVVPNKILPIKPTIAINDMFTQRVTGLRYGDYLYSIQLPSILGESFILFGKAFFWLHGIFLGIISALFFSVFKRYSDLKLWLIYTAISFIKVPRGGSQGFISEILNGSLGLLIVLWLTRFFSNYRGNKND